MEAFRPMTRYAPRRLLGTFSNWNAADAPALSCPSGRDTRDVPPGGRLRSFRLRSGRSVQDAGGDALFGHRPSAWRRSKTAASLRLHLARGGHGWGPGADGDRITVRARSVVLALPRRSLELLDSSTSVRGAGRPRRCSRASRRSRCSRRLLRYPSPGGASWVLRVASPSLTFRSAPLSTSHGGGPAWSGRSAHESAPPPDGISLLSSARGDVLGGLRSPSHAPPRAVGRGVALARAVGRLRRGVDGLSPWSCETAP